MRLSMALSAAAASLLLGGAALLGPVPAALAALAVIGVIAWGWPRQMGAPARVSLSVTLAVTGALAVAVMLLWPGSGEGADAAWGLFEPLALVLAWGTMASFVVQLVRGTGRPLRLESTVTTMGGMLVCAMAACWVGVARFTHVPAVAGLTVTLTVTVLATSIVGLTPWMQGRPRVLALVMVPVSGVAAGLVAAGMGAHSTPVHAVAALGAAALVSLTAATAPARRPLPQDRPVGTTLRPRRAGYALAMAPVGAAGVVGHVMVGLLA